MRQVFCPNCGTALQPNVAFCPNCGTKITSSPSQQQASPSNYPPVTYSQAPVSTGAYKAVIAVLLIVIVLLGIGLYSATSGRLFPFGGYHYTLSNPPSYQSTQPGPAATSQSPQYVIWNSCGGQTNQCTMTANGWREGSVPDTFDYYVAFTSSVNVTVYFFTMGQFVQYAVCNGDVKCVSGYYDSIPPTTSLSTTVFRLGEGCADYLAIYTASGNGVMNPTVGVTRNPSPPSVGPTGYCGQAGSG